MPASASVIVGVWHRPLSARFGKILLKLRESATVRPKRDAGRGPVVNEFREFRDILEILQCCESVCLLRSLAWMMKENSNLGDGKKIESLRRRKVRPSS
jgi:hypothetical protein